MFRIFQGCLILLVFFGNYTFVCGKEKNVPALPPGSRYLRVEVPAAVPIRIKKIWLDPANREEPDIFVEVANRSSRSVLYLSFDLLESDKGSKGKKLIYEAEWGNMGAVWGGYPGTGPIWRSGKTQVLTIPGKFMKNYYLGGSERGVKADLFFGYLVFTNGTGWEGHEDDSKWAAKKCLFKR